MKRDKSLKFYYGLLIILIMNAILHLLFKEYLSTVYYTPYFFAFNILYIIVYFITRRK